MTMEVEVLSSSPPQEANGNQRQSHHLSSFGSEHSSSSSASSSTSDQNNRNAVKSRSRPKFSSKGIQISRAEENQNNEDADNFDSSGLRKQHKSIIGNGCADSTSLGSMSGRSSTSSLTNVNQAGKNGNDLPSTILTPRSVKMSRKVSINANPVVVTSLPKPLDEIIQEVHSTPTASHRTSLIQASERRARKVRFFINADKFFKGAVIAVSSEKFRTFDRLLEHLTRIMCNQVTLPNGVRFIFGLDGHPIEKVDELQHGENYVCSSSAQFKKLDYLKMTQDQEQIQQSWKGMKRDTYYLGMGVAGPPTGKNKRDAYKLSGHSKSFGITKSAAAQGHKDNNEQHFQIKPKIIAVLKNGLRPRKAVRVLLNNRNTKSFDIILADLTSTVKLDTGAVRKVFTLNGKPVVSVADFAEGEVFIAYGVEKCCAEDFDLDQMEFRNVQSILKSPDLDAKYEKFANSASPRTSRRKFLLSRNTTKRRRKSHSKTRATNADALKNDLSASTNNQGSDEVGGFGVVGSGLLPSLSPCDDIPDAPTDVCNKYIVGEIIGDGNFAVVRKCISKRSRQPFALKVIDKSKCQGKEHMIESEIAILNLVSHPNIIELIEVFDFLNEKYLVTELVPGGDLFDAIAGDTKYSEPISRRMIADLTSALQYLHDKMIVHRDIKPENLLVVKLDKKEGSDARKSLKLGDFGLAQLVSEPLYTVCGTPTYVAPEILAETGYGVKVDVWATGVIMYILLVGFPPFSSRTNNQEELFDQILSGLFEFNSPDWDDISYPAKELISLMLQVDPLQRYSAYEILQHPWIKSKR